MTRNNSKPYHCYGIARTFSRAEVLVVARSMREAKKIWREEGNYDPEVPLREYPDRAWFWEFDSWTEKRTNKRMTAGKFANWIGNSQVVQIPQI